MISNFQQKKHVFIVFGLIVLVGAFLRLYKLEQYPPQLNRDEAALAINALYIKQAGVDEWGSRMPVAFKSFGDYKLPGYIYLLSGVFNFGINDYMVRLPSALAGVILIFVTSYWVYQLFGKKLSQISYFFLFLTLALTPFTFFYSRMAWEANVALTLMVSGLICIFHASPSIKKDLIGVAFFALASFTYNTPFLLLPFFILALPFFRGVRQFRNWLPVFTLLSVLFITVFFILKQNNTQKSNILFFTSPTLQDHYPEYRAQFPPVLQTIFGNTYVYYAQIGISHYLQTFSPYFLVMHGGTHPWHSIMGRGHLYWSTYVLFVIGFLSALSQVCNGLWKIIKKKKQTIAFDKSKAILLFLLLLSPIPAIVTIDAPHATRSLFTMILILIFSIFGFEVTMNFVKEKYKKAFIAIIITLALVLSGETLSYFRDYFLVWPQHYSPDFKLGVIPVLQKVNQDFPTGKIGVEDFDWIMYATVAWYSKIPADEALQTAKRSGPDLVGLYRVHEFGRFVFLNRQELRDNTGIKLIGFDDKSQSWVQK